jgi:carboxypeptidase family protein
MTTRRAVAQTLSLRTFVAAAFLLAAFANAQVEQGRFVGRIVDSQDAGVPGASVTVTNTGTNIIQTALTDGVGNFVITPVEAGVYSLSVTAKGFETTTSSNIEVQVGQVFAKTCNCVLGRPTSLSRWIRFNRSSIQIPRLWGRSSPINNSPICH